MTNEENVQNLKDDFVVEVERLSKHIKLPLKLGQLSKKFARVLNKLNVSAVEIAEQLHGEGRILFGVCRHTYKYFVTTQSLLSQYQQMTMEDPDATYKVFDLQGLIDHYHRVEKKEGKRE